MMLRRKSTQSIQQPNMLFATPKLASHRGCGMGHIIIVRATEETESSRYSCRFAERPIHISSCHFRNTRKTAIQFDELKLTVICGAQFLSGVKGGFHGDRSRVLTARNEIGMFTRRGAAPHVHEVLLGYADRFCLRQARDDYSRTLVDLRICHHPLCVGTRNQPVLRRWSEDVRGGIEIAIPSVYVLPSDTRKL